MKMSKRPGHNIKDKNAYVKYVYNNNLRKKNVKASVSDPLENRRLYKLIVGGAIASSATLLVSLFSYYQPFTLEDLVKSTRTVTTGISRIFHREDTKQEDVSDESVPQLVTSAELGNISDLNLDYSGSDDSVYMAMLDTSLGSMLYYNQGDRRWADYLYGGADPMMKYGCGPTAIAMLVNSFTSERLTPVELADWSAANGYYAPQGGSYHSLIPKSLSAFGLKVDSVKDYSSENVINLLRSNHNLVALMGRGALTDNGHFIIITNILDNGNVQIADPNSYENSTKEWNLDQLLSELKRSFDSGGPLWAVSIP